MRKPIQFLSFVFVFVFLYLRIATAQINCEKEEIAEVGGVKVWQLKENASFYFFKSKFSVDADGSPRAYHPDDIGLDNLSAAGYPGNWWALATDNDEPHGNPVIQGENDPYPGYYVSMTSLGDRRYSNKDPRRYINAEKIPFFVLPPSVREITNTELGDFGYVYNTQTQKGMYAIFADIGPGDKIGEGSIFLAETLGINSSPKTGGQVDGVIYIVFPFTGARQPRSIEDIQKKGKQLMEEIQGIEFLKKCLK